MSDRTLQDGPTSRGILNLAWGSEFTGCQRQAAIVNFSCTAYFALQVKKFEAFRRNLPETAQLIVEKNTLVRVASQMVPGWSDIKGATKVSAVVGHPILYGVVLMLVY